MPLDFPTSPALNEIYTFGGRSWIWNGTAWDSYNPSVGALTAGPGITLSNVGGNYTVSTLATVKGTTGMIQLADGDDLYVDTGFILDPSTATLQVPNGLKIISGGGNAYIEFADGTTQATAAYGAGGGGSGNNFLESTTAPTPTYAGDRWFDTDEGNLYTAITDDSGLIWVQLNAGIVGASGPQGNTGPSGIVGDYVISIDGATGAVNLKPFIIAMATAL